MTRLLPKGSMQRRLVIQLSLIALLLSLVLFVIVRGVAERAAADTQDNILAASATSIADALFTEGGQVRLELPYSALSMLGTISEDRVFYRVLVDGETLTGYDDLVAKAALGMPKQPEFSTFEYRGEQVRAVVVTRIVSSQSHQALVRIVVAQTRLGLVQISSRITLLAVAIGIAFFFVAAGLSLWAAHSALAPLNRVAGAVTRRGPSDLRAVQTQAPAELVPLITALNSLIERLKSSLIRSEDFIVEAAHRVRTPLATVRTQAEVIHRGLEKSKNKTALREMIRAIDESSRSAGQLLDHAMVNFRADQFQTEAIDLRKLMAETVERLSPTAELKDISIITQDQGGDFDFDGDPILLQNALRNILDNAIKYSPADSDITVALARDAHNHILSFTDQGRGFAGANLSDHLQRFKRGTNVHDIVGSGLGLTIVDEVARAHGGRVEITNHTDLEGGGACVSLYLPLV
ncbi:sensor histidine kinase N-terminal domain-containing protein [uncultured Planktomarina sp.]|jgi:two-component system sensor histidine kinase TctE|uniref:sensor histidine kinase N-terminal domain-containing protein n=1 Tax=uncultured Planktomarina sp. TaxID=1538529 RepID=UPI003260D06E